MFSELVMLLQEGSIGVIRAGYVVTGEFYGYWVLKAFFLLQSLERLTFDCSRWLGKERHDQNNKGYTSPELV